MLTLVDRLIAVVTAPVASAARRRPPDVSVVDLVVGDLGRDLDGYTVVALADFHHAPFGDLDWLKQAVEISNAMTPDLVVLLGDYGASFKRGRRRSRRWYQTALPEMESPCRRLRAADGLAAVLGNHDYYAGPDLARDWLRRIGARTLVNEAMCVRRGNGVLRVAGMDDLSEGHVDPRAGCDPATAVPTIVLSHNPDGVLYLARDIRVDVVLAGHTHGGQIVIPGYGAPITMSRVCGRRSAHGWVPDVAIPLYVTRGLGAQLPVPVRVNCRAEIVVLRLRAGPASVRVQQPV